jgi:hypothetical protein
VIRLSVVEKQKEPSDQRRPMNQIIVVASLCQWASALCGYGRRERPDLFVDRIVENVPATPILLRLPFSPTDTTLFGYTPSNVGSISLRIPPTGLA